MRNSNEIVVLEVDEDWIEEGLNYALISWTSTFNRMGKPNPYSRLEKILLGIIAEKGVEKYLTDNQINFETSGKTKWYETDRYDLGINGYAIDVKANFVDLRTTYISAKLAKLKVDKLQWFFDCHALVPMDQFNPGKNKRRVHRRDKVYVFPFVEGYFSKETTIDPLVHTFWDYRWLKRAEYKNLPDLGRLKISYDGALETSSVIIYGTTKKNQVCIEKVNLNSPVLFTANNFFQAFSLRWEGKKPSGVLKIESADAGIIEMIQPECSFGLEKTHSGYWPVDNNWQSMSLYQGKIYLLGWALDEDLRINGNEFKRFTKTIEQYSETKVDNWGCVISELEPMNALKNI